ncbi:MAG: hypothetical protein ACT4OM_05890 [Actinomycetota bacterium]
MDSRPAEMFRSSPQPEQDGGPVGYSACLAGAAVLVASISLQLIMILMLWIPLPERRLERFTVFGGTLYLPEHDIKIYLSGILAAGILALFVGRLWNSRIGSVPDELIWAAGARQLTAGVAGLAAFFVLYVQARSYPATEQPVALPYLVAFGVLLLASTAVALGVGRPARGDRFGFPPSRPPGNGERRVREGRLAAVFGRLASVVTAPAALKGFCSLDLIVPAGIVSLVYVVDGAAMAGRLFLEESLLHWDYFAMGPTLAVRHGLALGEVHSSYGVGWPMLFAALARWVPLTFGSLIQIGSIYACLYFAGAYLLLRMLVRPTSAALGTVLLLSVMVLAMGEISLWRIPSVSLLRWPFDVWCFIAMVLHFKTGRREWALAAGAAVGLGIVFVLDTGLYLAAAFALYWLLTLRVSGQGVRKGWFVPSVAIGVLVVFVGLGIASRWTIFAASFWRHWVETVLEFGGGFGMLPLATVPNEITLAAFVLFAAAGLVLMGYALMKAMYRRASHLDAFLGMLGFYGLLMMLHFIGRSGDYTPLRFWIPQGIALVILADRGYAALKGAYGRRAFAVPTVAAGTVLLILLLIPDHLFVQPVLAYPNPVNSLRTGSATGPGQGVCLIQQPRDICGLPGRLAPTVLQFGQITGELEKIEARGQSFAAVEEAGSLFYSATDTAPWGRYSRLFVSLRTKEQLFSAVALLEDRPVDYVLTRRPGEVDAVYELWPLYSFGYGLRPDSPISDTWSAFGEVVQQDYELVKTIGPYEIRKRKDTGP